MYKNEKDKKKTIIVYNTAFILIDFTHLLIHFFFFYLKLHMYGQQEK